MVRKRHSGITPADALLSRVIRTIEADDRALVDPAQILPTLRTYHAVFMNLLADGPGMCGRGRRGADDGSRPSARRRQRAARRADAVPGKRRARRHPPHGVQPLALGGSPATSFTVRLVDGRATVATGALRELIVLQLVLLVQEVGLGNVRTCSAPDCRRLYVRRYRREFCGPQCQKRINARSSSKRKGIGGSMPHTDGVNAG